MKGHIPTEPGGIMFISQNKDLLKSFVLLCESHEALCSALAVLIAPRYTIEQTSVSKEEFEGLSKE